MNNIIDNYQSHEYMRSLDRRNYYQSFPREKIFGDYKSCLRRLVNRGRILDYGCGHGSCGFLGEHDGQIIDGLDIDLNNKDASYHTPSDVKGQYDTIIFSHVLEHLGIDSQTQRNEIEKIMTWAHDHTKRVIVIVPNTHNPFTHFYDDWTHIRPLDNNDFLYFMEMLRWDLTRIIGCDAGIKGFFKCYMRILFSWMTNQDYTYNVVYDFMSK
jgi:hypothetical protein